MALVSIIIPTHNRARYAVPTIRAILNLSPLIQVVVSDTSEIDEITPMMGQGYASDRLRIVRPGTMLSVVDNFNQALALAVGDYLVFIGDDDLVSDQIVTIAQWAAANDIDALRCTFPASYYWPDFKSKYFGDGYSGRLSIQAFSGEASQIDPAGAFNAALGMLGGGVGTMPRAYLGMISKKVVDSIEAAHGALFGGVSPDIYSAALIANTARKVVELDYPFIVPGSSGASTSGQSASGGHKGSLRDNDHIRPFKDLVWDQRVPEFYSVPTVWAYSLVKAADRIARGAPNFERLFVKCLFRHPGYWREVLKALAVRRREKSAISIFAGLVAAVSHELFEQVKRVGRKIANPSATGQADAVFSKLENTEEASAALSRYLKDKELRLG